MWYTTGKRDVKVLKVDVFHSLSGHHDHFRHDSVILSTTVTVPLGTDVGTVDRPLKSEITVRNWTVRLDLDMVT